jgi:uncharacterized SAM-binding protein YcdF (DUF218 family)
MFGKLVRMTLQAIGLITILSVVAAALALPHLGDWLQVEDTPEKADYIVVLDGDGHRLLKAAELYRSGFAAKILLSNGYVKAPSRLDQVRIELGYPDIAPHELRARLLEHLGVPRAATETFGNGPISTLEEAQALAQFIGDRAATLILVTSPYHSRRAKLIFQDVMPRVRFMLASPPERRIAARWWGDQESAEATLTETAKLIYYWLGDVFRSRRAVSGAIGP